MTVLTWSGGNTIKHTDHPQGLIPGDSGNIVISYLVTVDGDVVYNTELNNDAIISTSSIEDDVYPNEDSAQVITATPDPYIRKLASTPSVLPGEAFRYTILC